MNQRAHPIDRRDFLKTVGAAGLSSALAGCRKKEQQPPREPNAAEPADADKAGSRPGITKMPTRKLGKTGVEVPLLSFGTYLVDVDNQILLRKTLSLGVNLWDTAYSYGHGNSELGIGKFLARNPEARKDIFLVTKASGARTPETIEQRLQSSLKRMNTDHIDLYHGLHQCQDPALITDELKKWADDAKARKLIKYFGITSHKNTAAVLKAASKCDWIDAVMFAYNFRLLDDGELQAAVDACHRAGIGLIAMKVMGMGQRSQSDADKKLLAHFLQRGFSPHQAKLKVVLEDTRFASVCVGMKNVKVLDSNVAAVFDRTELSAADRQVLAEYARATCTGYCAGCAEICEAAVPEAPYISDIMRYLMYYNSYGCRAEARDLFAAIPSPVRRKLPQLDYTLAEARCPQRLPIRKLVSEALEKLA